MKMFDVVIALEGIAEARKAWAKETAKFNADVEAVMGRLIREAAVNRMSPEQVARYSGLTPKRVRTMMREMGLNPRDGKTLIAARAAEHLQENAALLGVEPHEFDLMSPLAYLPMGSDLRKFLETSDTKVDLDEVDEPNVVEAVEALQRLADECLMHAPDKDAVHEDYALVHRLIGKVTA